MLYASVQLLNPVQVVACAEDRPILFNVLLLVIFVALIQEPSILFKLSFDKEEQPLNIEVILVAFDKVNCGTFTKLEHLWKT